MVGAAPGRSRGRRSRLRSHVVGRRRHLRRGRGHRAVRCHRRGGGSQPGPLGPDAGHDAVRHRRPVRAAARPLPGRGAGDRLRRGHRGVVPVRHHVPGRRPRGEHRRRAPAGAAPPGRGPGCPRYHRPAAAGPGLPLDHRRPPCGRGRHRPAVQRLPVGQVGLHHLPVPVRGHRGPAGHRRGGRGGPGPSPADVGQSPEVDDDGLGGRPGASPPARPSRRGSAVPVDGSGRSPGPADAGARTGQDGRSRRRTRRSGGSAAEEARS